MEIKANFRTSERLTNTCTSCMMGILALLTLVFTVFTNQAQKAQLGYKEIDANFSRVWNTSQEIRRSYSWYARTEVIRDGETVNLLIEKYNNSKDGQQKSQVISEDQAELPSIPLIRQMAEASKVSLVNFMKGLKVHLERYALTDDSLRHHFFSRATIGLPDANGLLMVTGTDVITTGDKLTWWINTNTYSITRATIFTTFEETGAEFTAFYEYYPTGLNYMTGAEIRVPGKNLVVKLTFYDHKQKN